ncbi:DUF6318 family protein [Kribbella sp. CA-294648]|uniref:DUF6318 family protein n=1 Tax=Kribbella sp. CA-294648 TaxID=3239948 RepID=UPI003D8B1B78
MAAAEGFLSHYIDLLNYASETGDPEPFLSESDKGCVGCKGIADHTRKFNVKNGSLKGDFKDRLVSVKEFSHGEEGRLFGSATLKTGTFEERVSPGASPVPQPASTGTMEFTLVSKAGNWVMYEMQINQ